MIEIEAIYLVVAVDRYTKKWCVLDSLYNKDRALQYLELAQKIYPEYNHFFVCQYAKSGIIAEVKPH